MADKKENTTGNTTQAGKRKRPPKYTGYKRVLYHCYIALTILSAIIVVGYIAFNLFSAAPNVNELNRVEGEENGESGGIRARPPWVTTTTDPETGKEIEIEIPGLSSDRKERFYTFLVVGQDQTGGGGAGNTDTMMLVAYDVPNQKLSVMSLPRDTYVRYRGLTVLLNSVYSRAGGGSNGIKRLKEEVGELTGVYPDFYVMVQWEAVGELVDAIGGVNFEVPFDMYYNDRSQHFKIDLKEGYQLLNGDKAMQLIRYRQNSIGDTGKKDPHYGYADGDLGRIRTQQAFMKAIIKKCLQPEVLVPNLGGFIDVFQRNVETNLSVGNMSYFGKEAIGGLDMDNVTFVTMPNVYAGDGHVLPIGSQLVTAINTNFNPYKSDIRRYELDLVDSIAAATGSPDPVVPDESPAPSGSPAPNESPDPSGSPRPSASTGPGSNDPDEPLLPGGATARPSVSPVASESPRTSERPRASESVRPSESAGSSESPPATATPTAQPTTAPTPPAEPSAAPATSDEEPVLPPGYLG